MDELSTILLSIISTATPLIGSGVWFFRKQNKRIKDAEASVAEINVTKAKVEAKAEDWHIWKEQNDALSEQNQKLIERNKQLVDMNAEKEDRHQEDIKDWESRFDKAVDRTREVQRENASLHEDIVELTKQNGSLKLELEKVRCNDLSCPFRLPPNIHTPPKPKESKEEFFKNKKK